jgi:two-component system sensor histidine kinase ChvG
MSGGAQQSPETYRKPRWISPLTRRILAINVLALGILVAGILYQDIYKENLIESELAALATQAEMFAVALSEGAVARTSEGQYQVSEISSQMVRRLVETTGARARLFRGDGTLIADSQRLGRPGGIVQIEELPPPGKNSRLMSTVLIAFERLANHMPGAKHLPIYRENPVQSAEDYDEAAAALKGEFVKATRITGKGSMVLSVAVPVQRYKKVLGALMLSKISHDIDAAILDVRLDILKVFTVALAVTVLLSLYLAGTIARPIRRLAAAAEQVRRDHSRQHRLPDFAGRNDEIGDLAETLNHMTEALWARMDAIECFAADVAHEIKNPLTSLRSAVETAVRLKDPEQQRKLMAIIEEDVGRLDRLISDISDASRLDAELSRAESAPLDLGAMLATIVEINQAVGGGGPRIYLRRDDTGEKPPMVTAIEGRLAQVFRNIVANARSFSPADAEIGILLSRDGDWIHVEIDDDGPGIPPGSEHNIFARFYSERPESEKFGTHSGLGLSISKQIIETHGGTISAASRTDADGRILGAQFTVRLPEVK